MVGRLVGWPEHSNKVVGLMQFFEIPATEILGNTTVLLWRTWEQDSALSVAAFKIYTLGFPSARVELQVSPQLYPLAMRLCDGVIPIDTDV